MRTRPNTELLVLTRNFIVPDFQSGPLVGGQCQVLSMSSLVHGHFRGRRTPHDGYPGRTPHRVRQSADKPPPSDSQMSSQPPSQRDIDGAADRASTDHAAWVYNRAKLMILCP